MEVVAQSTSAGPPQVPGLPAFRTAPPVGSPLATGRAPDGGPPPSASPAPLSGPGPGSNPANPGGLPALDVDRLTDQIVNRLDDRLIAHRERMGRAF